MIQWPPRGPVKGNDYFSLVNHNDSPKWWHLKAFSLSCCLVFLGLWVPGQGWVNNEHSMLDAANKAKEDFRSNNKWVNKEMQTSTQKNLSGKRNTWSVTFKTFTDMVDNWTHGGWSSKDLQTCLVGRLGTTFLICSSYH
jgi:hypothetical protein